MAVSTLQRLRQLRIESFINVGALVAETYLVLSLHVGTHLFFMN